MLILACGFRDLSPYQLQCIWASGEEEDMAAGIDGRAGYSLRGEQETKRIARDLYQDTAPI